MSRRNMWLVVAAIVIIAAAVAYAIVHKSNTKTSANTANSGYLGSSSGTSSTNSTTPSSSEKSVAKILDSKSDSAHGSYLVDGNGRPLYYYGGDAANQSNCSGSCLSSWPIYQETNTSIPLQAGVTVIERSDGKAQYAYQGRPLYYFSSDGNGATPSGDGVANFHLARP